MLVTLLTHPGDRQLAVQLCDHIRFLGNVNRHECLIVSPAGTDMRGIEDVLREAFGNVYLHQYPATLSGWPYGPNEAAAEAMMHVWSNPALLYHYLMLETDCVPANKHWLDYIDAEYRRAGGGAHMLGTRIDTVEIDTSRVVGRHTIGVAVYPNHFPQLCPLVKNLVGMTREYHRQNAMPMPWDAYFGPYTARMTAETTLIQHLARTRKVEDGCVSWDCASLDHAISQVRPDAALIHGSKDLAFLTAITGRTKDANDPREKSGDDIEQHSGISPRPVVCESAGAPREESRGQSSDSGRPEHQPEKPLNDKERRAARQEAKDLEKAFKLRRELKIKAMPGTPEWKRSIFLHNEMPWPKLRAHASKIGAGGFGKGNSKPAIINRVVEIEKEQRVEAWTKAFPEPAKAAIPAAPPLPVEEAPAVPVGSFPVSRGVKTTVQWKPVDDKGNPIPEVSNGGMTEMQIKMLALRNARADVLLGAPSAA